MSAKPSLDLLRSLTEEHILRALMAGGKLTRSDIAVHTGISKPTISAGMRRLAEAGLVLDTGERTTGRGQAGSYYTLAPKCGAVLVMSISPNGVVAEALDAFGDVRARSRVSIEADAPVDQVATAVRAAADTVRRDTVLPLRTAVLSAADPVDRQTGRLVHLPDAPFLVGDLDPVAALDGLIEGRVLVDNDVNWAARAQHADDASTSSASFLYLHLGEGLGCAVVSDGDVWRGHSGLAGEVAHLVTWGPGGRAMHLTEVFAELGLRRDSSTAIDVAALLERIESEDPDREVLGALARAIAGAMTSAVALADPERIVVGGTWGRSPLVVQALDAALSRLPRRVPVVRTTLGHEPEFRGARDAGLEQLRDLIVDELRDGARESIGDVSAS